MTASVINPETLPQIAIANCIAWSGEAGRDCAARYGGEEFAVLLPGATVQDAYEVAETIRRRLNRCRRIPRCSRSASASPA